LEDIKAPSALRLSAPLIEQWQYSSIPRAPDMGTAIVSAAAMIMRWSWLNKTWKTPNSSGSGRRRCGYRCMKLLVAWGCKVREHLICSTARGVDPLWPLMT